MDKQVAEARLNSISQKMRELVNKQKNPEEQEMVLLGALIVDLLLSAIVKVVWK